MVVGNWVCDLSHSNPSGAEGCLSSSIRVRVDSYRLNGNRHVDVRGSVEDLRVRFWSDNSSVRLLTLLARYSVSFRFGVSVYRGRFDCAVSISFGRSSDWKGEGGNEPGLIYALDGVLVTGKDSRNGTPWVVD